jgi:hypothetical protein
MANWTEVQEAEKFLTENEEIIDTIKEYIQDQIDLTEGYYESEDFTGELFNDINYVIENNQKSIEEHYSIKLTYDNYYVVAEQIEISIGGIFGPPNKKFYFYSTSLQEIEVQIEKDEEIAPLIVWDYVLKELNRDFCIHNRTGNTCFLVYQSSDLVYYFTLPEKLEV